MNRWYIPGVPPDIQALVERRNPTVRHYHQASEQCPTSPPCSTRPSASPPSAPIRKPSAAPPPTAATFSSSCPGTLLRRSRVIPHRLGIKVRRIISAVCESPVCQIQPIHSVFCRHLLHVVDDQSVDFGPAFLEFQAKLVERVRNGRTAPWIGGHAAATPTARRHVDALIPQAR